MSEHQPPSSIPPLKRMIDHGHEDERPPAAMAWMIEPCGCVPFVTDKGQTGWLTQCAGHLAERLPALNTEEPK